MTSKMIGNQRFSGTCTKLEALLCHRNSFSKASIADDSNCDPAQTSFTAVVCKLIFFKISMDSLNCDAMLGTNCCHWLLGVQKDKKLTLMYNDCLECCRFELLAEDGSMPTLAPPFLPLTVCCLSKATGKPNFAQFCLPFPFHVHRFRWTFLQCCTWQFVTPHLLFLTSTDHTQIKSIVSNVRLLC